MYKVIEVKREIEFRMLKIGIVGDTKVGKTSIVNSFLEHKFRNRASKKSDVVNFDLNIEKNPKSGFFPIWNYDIKDYLHDVYENRHRYMIYLTKIKDDQNVDHNEPDFTNTFLKEDKSDLYIRNLTVYCLKFQKF